MNRKRALRIAAICGWMVVVSCGREDREEVASEVPDKESPPKGEQVEDDARWQDALAACEQHLVKLDEEIGAPGDWGVGAEEKIQGLEKWFRERLSSRARLNARGGLGRPKVLDELDQKTLLALSDFYARAVKSLGAMDQALFERIEALISKYGYLRRVQRHFDERDGGGDEGAGRTRVQVLDCRNT